MGLHKVGYDSNITWANIIYLSAEVIGFKGMDFLKLPELVDQNSVQQAYIILMRANCGHVV